MAEPYIGIVAAEVNSIEQRQIMKGVISRAQELGRRIAVFSNVFNPYDYDEDLALENRIYELVRSPEIVGVILIAESFTNQHVQDIVRGYLLERSDIPIVVIGIHLPNLSFPNVHFINASDVDDMQEITEHLLTVHGVTKIDMLTGHPGNEAAENRVEGFRRALKAHGLPFDQSHVIYGDFWMTSGDALAKRYISGELPRPEAVVCANDYMAYGLLDTLMMNGVRVPDEIMVTGYEYIRERVFHTPVLSTYQRNRHALGVAAVSLADSLINGRVPEIFMPPPGEWIPGESCPCGINREQLGKELQSLRIKQQFDKWNVCSTMEQHLTRCSNLDEFIRVLGENHYLVRWVQDMHLCLCENWYDTHAEEPGELITIRSVMPWNSWRQPVTCSRFALSSMFEYAPETAAHYYLPLFFEKHLFGYFVLEYHAPDAYDDIFKSWIKSISNGLEFLCMKNDIRYLLQCQSLSEQHDSLTGLYNERGLERALSAKLVSDAEPVYAMILRIGAVVHDVSPEKQAEQTELIQKIAEILRGMTGPSGICSRIAPQTFICTGFPCLSDTECALLAEKLRAMLLNQTALLKTAGMESVIICYGLFSPDTSPAQCVTELRQAAAARYAELAEQRKLPHADTLLSVRNQLYETLTLSADAVCRKYSFSAGYFRQIYKECFGISFHQDTINARILRAVYLLSSTVLSIAGVAEQCGYEDYNYFLRQFQKVTGMTPGQYRRQG